MRPPLSSQEVRRTGGDLVLEKSTDAKRVPRCARRNDAVRFHDTEAREETPQQGTINVASGDLTLNVASGDLTLSGRDRRCRRRQRRLPSFPTESAPSPRGAPRSTPRRRLPRRASRESSGASSPRRFQPRRRRPLRPPPPSRSPEGGRPRRAASSRQRASPTAGSP